MMSDIQEFPAFMQRPRLYCAGHVTKLLTFQPTLHVVHKIFKVCRQSSYLDTYILSGIWQGLQSRTYIKMTHGAMLTLDLASLNVEFKKIDPIFTTFKPRQTPLLRE